MSVTGVGFVIGAIIAIVARVVLSGFGGASVIFLIPFAALLFGGVGIVFARLITAAQRAGRAE